MWPSSYSYSKPDNWLLLRWVEEQNDTQREIEKERETARSCITCYHSVLSSFLPYSNGHIDFMDARKWRYLGPSWNMVTIGTKLVLGNTQSIKDSSINRIICIFLHLASWSIEQIFNVYQVPSSVLYTRDYKVNKTRAHTYILAGEINMYSKVEQTAL